MRKIMNYISSGKGFGYKYFFVFSLLICVLGGVVLGFYGRHVIQTAPEVRRMLSQMPTLKFADGKLVSPKDTYTFVPFSEGLNSGIFIDTRSDADIKLNFDSGVYLTDTAMYVKLLTPQGVEQTVFDYSNFGTVTMDKAVYEKMMKKAVYYSASIVAGMMMFLLWAMYLILCVAVALFFWVLGYKNYTRICFRSTTLAWMGVLALDFGLMFLGASFNMAIAFGVSLLLAIAFVFNAKPKQDDIEQQIPQKQFFDTVPVAEVESQKPKRVTKNVKKKGVSKKTTMDTQGKKEYRKKK